MDNPFNNMKDLYDYHYRRQNSGVDMTKIQRTLMAAGHLRADDPWLTSVTGVVTDIYGQAVFDWLAKSSTLWKLLAKKPWNWNGWRVITADEATTAGIDENASFPETDKPDIAEIKTPPKYVASPWEITEPARQQAQTQMGVDGDLPGFNRKYYAKRHPSVLSGQLLGDVNTVAGFNFESIDRVISSQSEEAGALDAGDADIYGLDRSASTTYDAYVDHNSDVDRIFTLDLVDTMIENVKEKLDDQEGFSRYFFLTGHDTYRVWKKKLQGQQRFDKTSVKIDRFNGLQTLPGVEGGFNMSSYDNIPIFTSSQVVKDTLSRLYLINADFAHIRVALPTRLLETNDVDWLLVDAMKTLHVMVTGGELVAERFNCHGKIRDLKES